MTATSIEALKVFAMKLPQESLLRNIILLEPDRLTAEEIVSRLPLWLRAADSDDSHRV